MEDRKKGAARKPAASSEKSRVQFKTLVTSNPNYFGNLTDSPFKAVKKIVSNTSFEQLRELGYNPRLKLLSATFDLKKATGYGGDLCANGSQEFVRFYVDHGSGWQDVGLSATEVHDVPTGKDCANKNTHPLAYSVDIRYSPRRRWCTSPQLPRARAILSWDAEPPPNQPDWKPVYGNVIECNIQIDRGFNFPIFVDEITATIDLPPELAASIKKAAIPEVAPPGPDFPNPAFGAGPEPEPAAVLEPQALGIETLAENYLTAKKNLKVEPKRFAFADIQQIMASSEVNPPALKTLAASLSKFDIDISELVISIDKTSGNTSYEELKDLGLEWNQEKLVATYRVKKPSGFSGGLCSAGSTEYVAFWVDWEDTCSWEYIDTVAVKAYDFTTLPDGGLCYSAVLPVDLTKVRRGCDKPRIGRVRAVLSWNTPPSTTNPSAVPHWGNRLDKHVLIPPGDVYTGVVPRLTAVGGIGVPYIHNATGLTGPTARFIDNGILADSLGRPCPFAGRVVVRGPGYPGHRYRVQVREVGTAVWNTLTKKIWVTTSLGFGSWHTIDGDGWFKYLSHTQNFAGILAYFESSGDQKWDIRLQIEGVFGAAHQVVQLDNTRPTVAVSITEPVGDCGLFTPPTLLKGRAVANDAYMGGWSVVIDGGPAGFGPVPTTTGSSGSSNTPPGGSEWTFDTTGLAQCGYVVRVHARDRAIVNSSGGNHHRSTDVGFCVLEDS